MAGFWEGGAVKRKPGSVFSGQPLIRRAGTARATGRDGGFESPVFLTIRQYAAKYIVWRKYLLYNRKVKGDQP